MGDLLAYRGLGKYVGLFGFMIRIATTLTSRAAMFP